MCVCVCVCVCERYANNTVVCLYSIFLGLLYIMYTFLLIFVIIKTKASDTQGSSALGQLTIYTELLQ